MHPIDWDDDPSFPSRIPIPVFNVSPASDATIRFLGDYRGVWTHWIKGRPNGRAVPHFKKDCPHCKLSKLQWKAYVPSLRWRQGRDSTWVPVVCELTGKAFKDLQDQTEMDDLRGKVVKVWRGKTSSRMYARFEEHATRDLDHLPQAFDVVPILNQLWCIAEATHRADHVWEKFPPPSTDPVKLPPPEPKPVTPPPPVNGQRIKISDYLPGKNGGAK